MSVPTDHFRIRGATLLDAAGSRVEDLGIADGRIVPVDELDVQAIEIDATDCLVSTGLVDLKAHLGEPGDEAAETMASGGEAAVLGGYTTVLAMPDTHPPVDTAAVVEHIRMLGASALCGVEVAGTVTVGAAGERLAPLAELAQAGVRFVTDCGAGVQDPLLLRRALEYAKPLGLTIAQAADCVPLSRGTHMHEGEWSSRLGLAGAPAEAEEINVMRDISLVRLTGGRLHFQTLSAAGSFAIVSAAAQSGLPISSSVTTHHLRLCDADLAGYDTCLKVTPPLRAAGDARAAMSAVAAGRVDVIVSDHRPHTTDRKERPFDHAATGSVGLETSLAAALCSGIDHSTVLRAMSWRPAQLVGLGDPETRSLRPGAPADIVIIDPTETWTVSTASMATLGTNSAFEGTELTGRVRSTFVGGRLVVDQGKVAA
ncbi:MAG: dihydroorotase [Actinomycetota bacterium]